MRGSTLKRFEYHNPVLMILVTFVVALVLQTSDSVLASLDTRSSAPQAIAQETKPADVRELKVGEPTKRELAGGETHTYRVGLTAGQYMRVLVEQKGADVVVRLFELGGQKLTEVNNDPTPGSEAIFIVAEASGAYRVEVQSSNKDAKAGTYEIKIEELREAASLNSRVSNLHCSIDREEGLDPYSDRWLGPAQSIASFT